MKLEVRGTWAKGRARMRWMDNIRHDELWFGDGRHPRQEKMEEDGTEPRPGSLADKENVWGAVAQWIERATDNRVVARSNPTETAWKLWQFPLPHFASVFRKRH